ncbi:MAG: hypothetical protein N4A57_11960, partial [Anaeromicrobium sp.]|uniref:GLUG motif-containing protein n=1 Tax=Anaeromicrobium sp. TaxID=1929132 RepID=UPI0025D7CF08
YALGSVEGDIYIGGLVGEAYDSSLSIRNCYSAGKITGRSYVGGTIGYASYLKEQVSTYYDGVASGYKPTKWHDVAKTTEEMMNKETYKGWDFNNIWKIEEGRHYPYLD